MHSCLHTSPHSPTHALSLRPHSAALLQVLDANDAEQARAADIFTGISSLRESANKGDVKTSKQTFVAVVSAMQDWAKSTGLATNLKGL